MEYPIYEHTQNIGTLFERTEGLYRVYEAELPFREGLQRLWLCGETQTVCLGLLEPGGKGLRLQRRLSRQECAKLPAPVRFASLTEPGPPPPPPKASPPDASRDTRGVRYVRLFGERFVVFRS